MPGQVWLLSDDLGRSILHREKYKFSAQLPSLIVFMKEIDMVMVDSLQSLDSVWETRELLLRDVGIQHDPAVFYEQCQLFVA